MGARRERGTVHLVLGDDDAARRDLREALRCSRELAWTSYLPFLEALLAIVELRAGEVEGARARLEHAFALGCQIRDRCWEGISAAGLALVAEAEGDLQAATERFEDATRRSVREPDAWLWGHALALEMRCAFGVRHGLEGVRTWIADLESLASRTMMRDFLARAFLHRAALGDPDALEAARIVAADVDNPTLGAALPSP